MVKLLNKKGVFFIAYRHSLIKFRRNQNFNYVGLIELVEFIIYFRNTATFTRLSTN